MNQGINFYKTYDVIKISQCHESNGAKTLTPNSRLDRWNAVHDAITSWLINDANDDVAVKVAEERFQFHDPLQKKIMSELFERFRKLYILDIRFIEYKHKDNISRDSTRS